MCSKKMAALEAVARRAGARRAADRPERARAMQVVARAKELMDKELLALADDIATHPEIGFEEKRSVSKLTDYLRQHNFSIETGTARPVDRVRREVSRSNNGSPDLGIIVEYDALRGTKGAFHGDQHSAQGPVGIAAAVAMAEYLTRTNTPGSVVVFGAPGEEMMPPNAKTEMHEAHAFDGADVIVRSHASSATSRPAPGFGTCCLNIVGAKYTFSGAPAHQMTPWNGRNALDGDDSLVQQHRQRAQRASGPRRASRASSLEGGTAPNVVPDRTVADFYIRYPDEVYLAAGGRVRRQRGEGGGAGDRHEGEDRSLRQGSSTASASPRWPRSASRT